MKTLDQHFIDWESHVFGLGYGTGEPHIIASLKSFMDAIGTPDDHSPNAYTYSHLENVVGPAVTWLLITMLIRADIIEYGTSPRFGWLTEQGIALKQYVGARTNEQLLEILEQDCEDYYPCQPDFCNCDESGFSKEKLCHNPFWVEKMPAA